MKNHSEHIDRLLARHFANEPLSLEENGELMDWMVDHKDTYQQLARLLSVQQYDCAQAWEKIRPQLAASVPSRHFSLRKVLAYAACLVLLVGVTQYFFSRGDEDSLVYRNTGSELMAVTLPDQSSVVLHPQSQLTFQQVETGRKIEMEGKAFFKVKPQQGQPFVVNSKGVEVRVLGTSFLVDNLSDTVTSVYVREGLVRVSADEEQVLLHANQQAKVAPAGIQKDTLLTPAAVFQGYLPNRVYRNAPMAQVIEDIETEFHVEIIADEAVLKSRISTTLHMTRVEELLEELCYICHCRYEQLPSGKYQLTADGGTSSDDRTVAP